MADRHGKLFTSEIFFANLPSDRREIGDHSGAVQRIFFYRRTWMARLAFAHASSFRPKGASIKPSTHSGGP